MKGSSAGRSGLAMCAIVAVLAGCGAAEQQGTAIPPASHTILRASSYQVLYGFRGRHGDGTNPEAGLTNVNGTLYGATAFGGSHELGTIFSITTAGKEKVIYSFSGGADGAYPLAGLLDVHGTLYGTTGGGGDESCSGGCGTVFSITTNGTEKILYSFGGGVDGAYPLAGLLDVHGTLYGTTGDGGSGPCSGGCGTVFSITTDGTEKVIYSFDGGRDGAYPRAGLLDVHGTLYGTTVIGGKSGSGCGSEGCGTVFSITTDGTEKVLYRFGGTDGSAPYAPLVNLKGTLYGTTFEGGTHAYGTVFSITVDGLEKVLHSFGSGNAPDGSYPQAGMIGVNGTLYGTTEFGGDHDAGTVFSIGARRKERVLYSFGGGTDGADPYAPLVNVKGVLYGTTFYGGAKIPNEGFDRLGPGHGTVFALAP